MFKYLVAVVTLCSLIGCANMSQETKIEEGVWQAGNVVDATQTMTFLKQPNCFQEVGEHFFPGEQPVFGHHPSDTQVSLFSAAFGMAHLGITELLVHYDANPWIIRTWEFASIVKGGSFQAVSHNYHEFGNRLYPKDPACH